MLQHITMMVTMMIHSSVGIVIKANSIPCVLQVLGVGYAQALQLDDVGKYVSVTCIENICYSTIARN